MRISIVRSPLLFPMILGALAAGTHASDGVQDPGPRDVIYYDYVEAGQLRGGTVRIDPGNPLHAAVPPRPDAPPGGSIIDSTSTTIESNGPSSNRYDIVFVGDGYTAAEIGSYSSHVSQAQSRLFNQEPFKEYRTFFNVHRVDVVSLESGVDNDPVLGILKNTALDMGFWCGGVQRLLCINVFSASNEARNAPDTDHVLALANSRTYGGAGYPTLATFAAANALSMEIALHELGHSMVGLADEYTTGGPSVWTGGEPVHANASIFTSSSMASQQTKWWRWLGSSGVGTYQGALYSPSGVYRPTFASKMRVLGRPFEAVNRERFIFAFYSVVRPIDTASPAGVYAKNAVLFVKPVHPAGHSLTVQWMLDGNPIAGATGETLDLWSLGLGPGSFTVSVEVRDPTSWVRDEGMRQALMTQTRSWSVTDAAGARAYGCGTNPADSMTVVSGAPRLGGSVVLGLDNPVGSQAGGFAFLGLSIASPGFPCGVTLPGFGMVPGQPGELLLDLAPASLISPFRWGGAPWAGPGSPAAIVVPIPSRARLLGWPVHAQGVIFDPVAARGVALGLTDAVQLLIGT